jgi:lipid A ethanolaminephosphotransferase
MEMTANRLCLLVAVWIVLTANSSFWQMVFKVQGNGGRAWLFFASLFVALVGLNLLLLRLLSPGRSLRVMLSVLLLLAAAAGWFMDTYGVAIDSDMLRNALQTNAAEADDFLGWPLLWRLLWQAGLPMAVIWRVRLPEVGWLHSARDYLLGVAIGVALLFTAALPMYSSYASYFRNQDAARYLIAPANVVVGSTTLLRKSLHKVAPYVKVGEDARRLGTVSGKPLLVLLVIGETARAANFSLGGYARPTNPLLQQRDIYYFSNVQSCGTATAVSLPCMFSDLPRAEFKISVADRRDSVLDILQRAGLAVSWIDNQSGCKKVCARVPHEAAEAYHPSSCADGECLDDTLLHALDARLPGVDRDALLVMHAMGSHGPTYYRRVPPDMVKFQPTCATERIETCTDEQIVNAYDNSIVYTDYVLAGLIDRLAANAERVDSVLLYVSDHGESLGENGLYLHGQPYMIAPALQKHVPMLLWFSRDALPRLRLDAACLRGKLDSAASHDHLSHTLLGLQDVGTGAYRAPLDLLRDCRSALPEGERHVAQ